MTLPRSITVPAAIILAAASVACMVLTSLSTSTESSSPNLDNRRQLKLMPQKEIIRYGLDPKTIKLRGTRPGDEGYWWKDINYRQRGLCGGEKCFFVSMSDSSKGYLIGDGNFHKVPRLAEAVEAYTYAAELEAEYNFRHFYADPPYEMNTPSAFVRNLWGDYKKHFGKPKSLIIQPSRTAPEGSIIIRCYNDRVLYGRLLYILQSMSVESKQNLLGELESVIQVVEAQPVLINDFQLVIDTNGRTYHLDLNRVKRGEASQKDARNFEGCLEGAVKYVGDSINGTVSVS